MSFISEVTRLKDAKNDIRTSIINKGVDVDSSATISSYSEFIDMIPPYTPVPANLSECEYDNIGRLISCTTNSNVTSIDGEFRSCSKLASVSMPNVTVVNNYSFRDCTSLASVSMPNVTAIGQQAFYGCTSLTSVDLPNAVSVFNQSFQGCTKLTSVTMAKVEWIYTQAFYGCTSLTSVDLPATVKAIYTNAFSSCKNLASVTCRGTTPPTLNTNVFVSTSSNLVIYVPAESVETYKTAENWSTYADRIQAIP